MQELKFEQVNEVNGGVGVVGGAVGGVVGAVGGFFVGAARVAFSSNHTNSLSQNFRTIGMATFNGAWAGATVGSGVGLVGGAISAGAGLVTNEIVSEISTSDE